MTDTKTPIMRPTTRRGFLRGSAGAASLAALASVLPREVLANPAD